MFARFCAALTVVLATALGGGAASAFCGFYVATGDGSLYNRASKVVYVRDGERSWITMSSDYRGPVAEFAMIVPTPGVLNRRQIRTVPSATVEHLDRYTAPRLVEYFDYDPCEAGLAEPVFESEMVESGRADRSRRDGAKALGVTIERQYAVGIYDILMLSATQSDGLVTFLTGEGYKLPQGAEQALAGYVDMGMKFFVAKVNLGRHAAGETRELEPLQLSFRSKDFMLPLQLGKLNGDGPQDLLVMTITRNGRVELANHPMRELPSDINVPVFIRDRFPQFYTAMFDRVAGSSGAFLEYAWDMAWCDPCAADPLSHAELKALGVGWVRKSEAQMPDAFVTRIHIRYDKTSFTRDLMFRETTDRGNFQGRYILNHPFDGEIACAEGATYVKETRARIRAEAEALRKLTGWSRASIAKEVAATVEARYR